jgi:hypothetical protein
MLPSLQQISGSQNLRNRMKSETAVELLNNAGKFAGQTVMVDDGSGTNTKMAVRGDDYIRNHLVKVHNPVIDPKTGKLDTKKSLAALQQAT